MVDSEPNIRNKLERGKSQRCFWSMPRGYRSVFIVVVGWLVLANGDSSQPPEPSNTVEQDRGSRQIESAANTIAVAIRNSHQTPERDAGCEDRLDRRNSDLCAQWKAADAAERAASYAGASILIGLISTGLLVWTLWETRASSRRELRAYIRLSTADVPAHGSLQDSHLRFDVHNYGETPALEAMFRGRFFVGPVPLSEPSEGDWTDSGEGVVLHPEASPVPGFAVNIALNAEQAAAAHAFNDDTQLYVVGRVEYRDVWRAKHVEQFCVVVRYDKPQTPFVQTSNILNVST